MATMVGMQRDEAALLMQAYELELDIADAYEAALARLGAAAPRARIAELAEAHRGHLAALAGQIAAAGGRVPDGPDVKQLLTRGKVLLAAPLGDYAVVTALTTNEDDAVTAYGRAAGRTDLSPATQALVRRLDGATRDQLLALRTLRSRIDQETSEAGSEADSLGEQDTQLRARGSRGDWLS